MIWSSPPKTQPTSSRAPHPGGSRILPITSLSYQESSIYDKMPQYTNNNAINRNLQSKSRSALVQGRPSTATSFTTSSSYMTFDRQHVPRSPSLSSDDDVEDDETQDRTFRSRSSTPVVRKTRMLPYPPIESSGFSSQRTDDSYTIPSAQPQTPIIPYSPQVLSTSFVTASLPSPPPTQERKPYHEDPTPSTPNSPPRRNVNPQKTSQNPKSVAPKHYSSPQTARSHRTRDVTVVPPTPESDDSELITSVLEGIGRMHVTMGRDDAGRWRIKRAGDGRY